MQFKTMAIYSDNRMTAINIILGRVSGGQNGECRCVMSKHVECTVTSKI